MTIRKRAAIFAGTLLSAVAGVAVFATPGESSAVYQYSIGPMGEYCGGACREGTLCCRIEPL